MVTTLKELTLRLDDGTDDVTEAHCQLTRCAIVDNPDSEDIVTFCGKTTSNNPVYTLELSGFADWEAAESVFELLHKSYRSFQDETVPDQWVDFEVKIGTGSYRSGQCKPQNDVTFGGDAGSAMTSDITCDIDGTPDETALAP